MNEFITQLNVIKIAIDNLEQQVKVPKDMMQRTHFLRAIGDIKTAHAVLKDLIDCQAPGAERLYKD